MRRYIKYNNQKYPIELKYVTEINMFNVDTLGCDEGWMIVFDKIFAPISIKKITVSRKQ